MFLLGRAQGSKAWWLVLTAPNFVLLTCWTDRKKPLRNKAHKKDEWSAQSGMSERWLVGSPFNGRLFLCFSHVLFLSKLSVWYWFPSQMRLSCLIPLTQSNMVPAMAKTSWIFKTSKIFNLWELTFTVFYRLSYAVIFFVFPFST